MRLMLLGGAGVLLLACAPNAKLGASENRTFYQSDDMPTAGGSIFERPYPPLDQKVQGTLPEYTGVTVLGGTVRLSRPVNWKIRRASLVAGKRFIEYVSPNEYLFAIYERTDSPGDCWGDALTRYEEDVKAKGGEIVASKIPVATYSAQGREYIVKRTVKGQRAPYSNLSSEIILQGKHTVDLVEIVHQGESIGPIGGELLHVMETMDLP
jgi:hypothetical protein